MSTQSPAVLASHPSGIVPLTEDEFKAALPDRAKKSVNKDLIDAVNAVLVNPEFYEHYRDNLISYTSVMQDGKYKIQGYLDAVKYVSHKLMDCSNIDAYGKTFPGKIAGFKAAGVSDKDISSYVSAYNKGQLVNAIFAQARIPSYVLNQDLFQRALNVQAALMIDNNVSPKVRSDAANSLLTHLKPPEVQKVELSVGVGENDSIKALRDATMALAAAQRMAIGAGSVTAQEIAHSKVILPDSDGVYDVEAKSVQQ